MARKKTGKPETKSDFLRKALRKNPNLEYHTLNRRWVNAGHPEGFSSALYYQIRTELGIKSEWGWFPAPLPRRNAGSSRLQPRALSEVYQFKITLLDAQPPIWRRIRVEDCTLDMLHEHIQTAMGWTNSHLHQFRIDEQYYGDPLLMEETFEELEFKDSTTTLLSEVLPRSGKGFKFRYEYDFGDSWEHEVRFEGRVEPEPGEKYPLCLEGARACPPEDVGGTWGYADFVEAIANPKHERYHEFRGWIGRKFDPQAFNPAAATRAMKKGLPDWRRGR